VKEWELHLGDCLRVLPALADGSAQTCCTSPPYFGLRDYGCAGQIGLESTPDEYVARLVEVFREVRRVLRDDGTLWLNLGDSYGSGEIGRHDLKEYQGSGGLTRKKVPLTERHKHNGLARQQRPRSGNKQLLGIPWRVAFALQADGWILRSDIIWAKPNPMPESMHDRPTRSHEYLFLMAKQSRYWYNADAIAERALQPNGKARLTGQRKRGALQSLTASRLGTNQGCPVRNKRSVWTVTPKPFKGAHFAVMPPALVLPCVLAGCPEGGTVLDPFAGAGTVGVVAVRRERRFVGVELNPDYHALASKRLAAVDGPLFAAAAAGGGT
jgi:DNA modification methylase